MEHGNQKNKIYKILVNLIIKKGKKNLSEIKINNLFRAVYLKTKQKPLFILEKSLQNLCIPIRYHKIPTRKGFFLYNLCILNPLQQLRWSIRLILKYSSFTPTNIINIFFKKKNKIYQEKRKYFYFLKKNKFNLKTINRQQYRFRK